MKALVASRKGLLIYELNGESWELKTNHFDGVKVSLVHRNKHNGDIWAAVNHGHWGVKLHHSTDDGKSFREVAAPKFPEASNISLKEIWALEVDAKGRVYVGTLPEATLFHSDDNGESWNLNEALMNEPRKDQWFGGGADEPCLHSIVINPTNADHLYVAISCGGVLESTDRGLSWNYRTKGLVADFLPEKDAEVGQDPHLVVMSPNNPNILWQQNHCGLFKSTDGAKSWDNLSEKPGLKSSFGWAIAVDEEDPNIAYTLPSLSDETRVPVEKTLYFQKTIDGGESWKSITNGLPEGDCYDIVYRHALGLKGKSLAFATTTGNFYWSNDAGESWKTISTTLPPVYSVELV